MDGLGIIDFGGQIGHEGEAIGWEGWSGRDPESGLTLVVFTNTCAVGTDVLTLVSVLQDAFGN